MKTLAIEWILIGGVLGLGISLIVASCIIQKYFPKNKVPEILEEISEWVVKNLVP